jgi:hypothetical protein
MKISGIFTRSMLKEKFPMDGSKGVLHDVSFMLLVYFMVGNNAFEGCLKLSHIVFLVVVSIKTRFP